MIPVVWQHGVAKHCTTTPLLRTPPVGKHRSKRLGERVSRLVGAPPEQLAVEPPVYRV